MATDDVKLLQQRIAESEAAYAEANARYEAVQKEYSAGGNFLTGAAEEDRQRRENAAFAVAEAKLQELAIHQEQLRWAQGDTSSSNEVSGSQEQIKQNTSPDPFADSFARMDKKATSNTVANPDGTTTITTTLPDGSRIIKTQTAEGVLVGAPGDGYFAADPALSEQQKKNLDDANSGSEGTTVQEQGAVTGADSVQGTTAQEKATQGTKPPQNSQLAKEEPSKFAEGLVDYDTIKYNPLHRLSNYTYNVALHLIPPEYLKELYNGSTGKFVSNNVLIASGGKYAGPVRNAQFGENFFIEELDVMTVIGLNAQTQGSNAVNVTFNIIEPNGVTLLERLIRASNDIGADNYMELSYGLTIEFIGYDENGKIVKAPEHNKVIPIKITGITFSVNEEGTVYKVSAVPYNHQAFMQSAAFTPVDVTVVAKTVADYFTDPTLLTANEREELEGETILTSDIWVESWSRAVNRNQQKLVEGKKQEHPDVYNVIIDNSIGLHLVNKDPGQLSATQTPMSNENTNATYGAVMQTISAGTSVLAEINRVIRNSDYFLKQFDDPIAASKKTEAQLTAELTDSKTLKWWKVTSKVIPTQYDHIRHEYAKEVTYYVTPYEIYGSDYPGTPKKNPKPVKRYEYIYTGRNIDVLDFSINFNAAYYVPVSDSFKKNISTTMAAEEKTSGGESAGVEWSGSPNNIANVKKRAVSGMANASASAGTKVYPKQVMAGAIQEMLMNSIGGDLMTLDISIVGDPDFIKQDDILITGLNRQGLNTSLDMDTTEVYAEVIFKTPVDYDETTGISKSEIRSKFSGFYRITSVFSQFRGGVFTQKLEGVRIFTDTIYNKIVEPKPTPSSTYDTAGTGITVEDNVNPYEVGGGLDATTAIDVNPYAVGGGLDAVISGGSGVVPYMGIGSSPGSGSGSFAFPKNVAQYTGIGATPGSGSDSFQMPELFETAKTFAVPDIGFASQIAANAGQSIVNNTPFAASQSVLDETQNIASIVSQPGVADSIDTAISQAVTSPENFFSSSTTSQATTFGQQQELARAALARSRLSGVPETFNVVTENGDKFTYTIDEQGTNLSLINGKVVE